MDQNATFPPALPSSWSVSILSTSLTSQMKSSAWMISPSSLKWMPAASTVVRVLQPLPDLLPPADDIEVLEEVLGGVLLVPQNRVS